MRDLTRSPLKDKPLRLPGQSLEEERRALLDDKLETPLLMALFFVIIAALEWWRDFMNMKPEPVVFSLAAAVVVAFTAWRIFRLRPRLRALRLGIAANGQWASSSNGCATVATKSFTTW